MYSQKEAIKLQSVWSGAITRNSDRKKSSEAEGGEGGGGVGGRKG